MNSDQLTAFITAIANSIASKQSIDEITLLSSIFVQLGDTLSTIAAQRSICEAKDDKSNL